MVTYLDNAATSWPKPNCVINAMTECILKYCGNPGRSGHEMSIKSMKVIYDCRKKMADLIKAENPLRIIFTKNATEGINIAIIGMVTAAVAADTLGIADMATAAPAAPAAPAETAATAAMTAAATAVAAPASIVDTTANVAKLRHFPSSLSKEFKILTTGMEHNAVARTLNNVANLCRGKVKISYVIPNRKGYIDPEIVSNQIAKIKPDLVICTLASNVNGTVAPVSEIGRAAKDNGAVFLVDAAQGAGYIDIDIISMNIDMLAFSGHKGLLGPQGTGGLYIGSRFTDSGRSRILPLICGGTGNASELLTQPGDFPGGFESGTLNTPGIAGLAAGLEYLSAIGLENIRNHKKNLALLLIDELKKMGTGSDISLLTSDERPENLISGIVAFNVKDYDSSEVANTLSRDFSIAVRGGLHCAPLAHMTLQTLKTGAIRVSFGLYNTEADIEILMAALRRIV